MLYLDLLNRMFIDVANNISYLHLASAYVEPYFNFK